MSETRLQQILGKMERTHQKSPLSDAPACLVAASKAQQEAALLPLLAAGLRDFAENRVQEAQAKWPPLRARFPDVRLHLIGPLQSNKAAEAVALFDVIQTVDREKIACALDAEMRKQNRRQDCYVQVNIGREPQKSGVMPEQLGEFLAFCRRETSLPVLGLMCVPPADMPPAPYFALMRKLKTEYGLPRLSMGMSSDFETAIAFGATEVRVGTALFGERNKD